MTTRKRNEWLDTEFSEDDEEGYDSEAAEESRRALVSRTGRSVKRQKKDTELNSASEEDVSEAGDDDKSEEADSELRGSPVGPGAAEADEDFAHTLHPSKEYSGLHPRPKLLAPKAVAASQRTAHQTGVVYLSRVPPFMKPQTVKHLLNRFGPIGRIFLTPETNERHSARVRLGGNKKRSFTDGWVEFQWKKDAKLCASALNAQIIGGKKGGWYHDDVWNIKYLRGFKWHHLTEQIANENAERVARMRAEIAQTTRENKAFLANVEKAKMLENMKAKKRQRGNEAETNRTDAPEGHEERGRLFKQKEVRKKSNRDDIQSGQPEEVRRVLSKIF